MAQVSDWQTEEAKNTSLDELTLSGEGGLYTNKIMCAVKKKFDEVDVKLDAVAGGLVWRGTKATYADLEAVTDPAVGDMYSVTELGGANFAWDGTAWDGLGTSDANVVHKTGDETVGGSKTLTSPLAANSGITINSLEVVPVANNAGAHNSIYRGKNLTEIYTVAQLHSKISAGDFSDLFIGDYLTKHVTISYSGTLDGETIEVSCDKDVNFIIAHFDYWYGIGDTPLNSHHIVFVPDDLLFKCKMRKTDTTSGGIPGTNVWSLLQNQVYSAINDAVCFNGNILTHRDAIPDAVDVDAASAAGCGFTGSTVWASDAWRDVKCGLLHEPMVYGGTCFSSSGYDTGCGKSQLALFALDPTWIHGRSKRLWFWLGAVASSAFFCHSDSSGNANCYPASNNNGGVRPYFLFG